MNSTFLYLLHGALWFVAVFQGLAICLLVYLKDAAPSQPPGLPAVAEPGGLTLKEGSKALSFEAIDLRSNQAVATSTLRGPLLLVFVASRCAICHEVLAAVGEVAQRERDIIVYCEGSRRGCSEVCNVVPNDVRTWGKLNLDPGDVFGLATYPAIVSIDSDWRIDGIHYPTSRSRFRQILRGERDAQLT